MSNPIRTLMTAMSLALCVLADSAASARTAHTSDAAREVIGQFEVLLTAENRHDLPAVQAMFQVSPDALFVGKAPAGAAENWTGFWGADAANQIAALWKAGRFSIVSRAPPRAVVLSKDVVELYAPVTITVAYAGQSGTPKPFLLILNWVRSRGSWKIAADIAIAA